MPVVKTETETTDEDDKTKRVGLLNQQKKQKAKAEAKVDMIDTNMASKIHEMENTNLNYALLMRQDLISARRITADALQEVQALCEMAQRDIAKSCGVRLLYGTVSGSIGVFFQISQVVHAILD